MRPARQTDLVAYLDGRQREAREHVINLVGKIMMVLITVLSILFMSFAVAVYMTHQDWRAGVERPETDVGPGKPLGLKFQLAEAQAKNEALTAQLESLKKQVETETLDRQQRLAKLEHTRVQRVAELARVYEAHATLLRTQEQNVADLKQVADQLEEVTAQVAKLRQEIAKTEQLRNGHFANVLVVTEQVHEQQRQLRLLEERRVQLAAQVERERRSSRESGRSAGSSSDVITKDDPRTNRSGTPVRSKQT